MPLPSVNPGERRYLLRLLMGAVLLALGWLLHALGLVDLRPKPKAARPRR